MKTFTNILISWYITYKRELPWRGSSDAYEIWLSEIILQQTRVSQGLEYYNKILRTFPTIFDLANASIDEILKCWQGLGYYSRARNLYATAKIISEQFHGVFPSSYDELIKLKGIGSYTAAAIASIAFKRSIAAVDGNVSRVLSRVYGIKTPVNKAKNELFRIAQSLIDKKNPGTFNEAMMEFGATWCTPKKPKCEKCPLADFCYAFKTGSTDKFPVKEKEKQIAERFFNYIVITEHEHIYLRQRKSKDIWKLLYDFKLIETSEYVEPENLIVTETFRNYFIEFPFEIIGISKMYHHKLTHQRINARFFKIKVKDNFKDPALIKIRNEDVKRFAVPRLIEKYLSKEFEENLIY